MDIEKQAEEIAKLICEVDPNDRGNLFVLVGAELSKQVQGYTGVLVRSIGYDYGLNPNKPGHPKFK